jgi:acyl-CoA synthetase (AMP-forming)/AMP-acid ligase II
MAQLSYVHGASGTPFIGEMIGVHFDRIVERFAKRDALIVRHQQTRWTYRELKERVDAFAAGLSALGLKRGDRIGIWSPKNAEWVVTQFATAKAGLILVNIDAAGWMHAGDLATIDAEGYCNIVGRIKDMVIRGGENDYPREIEEFLYRHPRIRDVQVIGIPDERYGQELCAWVRLREGENATAKEIRAFCQGQIAHYKVARYVKFVDGFPMTVTGKIQKFLMRQQMIDELGLNVQETA